MHELQRKANKFRQGYKNWRQKKPRGASISPHLRRSGCVLVCTNTKTRGPTRLNEPILAPPPLTTTTGARGEATELKDQRDEEEDAGPIPGGEAGAVLQHGRTISLARGEGKKLLTAETKEAEPEPEVRGMRRGKSFSVSITAQVGR